MKKQTPFPATGDLRPLVDRAQAGDQAAFTELYEQTSTDLYRIVHAMVRDEDLTWDILQNTYVRVYRSLPTLRDSNAFWPWLRQIAVNETATQTAQRLPLSFSDVSGAEDQAFEIPDERSEVQPELSLDRKETARLVQEILDGLSDGQRLLVGMYYFQELPIREIAERLAITPGTVKKQLARSRAKIEDAVIRLEKQGVKLYGLSPLPFLLALLRRQEPAAEAEKAALAKTVETVGLRARAKAAAPVAEAVGVHVGRPFFETGLGRVVLGVLSAAVIGGGVLVSNVLDNRSYGDVRPPESIETAEDLSTEPTEPVPTRPDTAEDLVTEPETTEPVTTELETTEAESTEPSEATEAPAPADLSGPSNPAPQPEQPTDPTPSASSAAPDEALLPRVVSCFWGEGAELYDQPWGSSQYVYVITENGGVPWLYTDNESVVQIQSKGNFTGGKLQEGQTGYLWRATFLGSGTAHIYCELDWKVTHVLTVTNPEYPETVLECDIFGSVANLQHMEPGDWAQISILVQGMTKPHVYTDRPDVLNVYCSTQFTGAKTSWIHKGYYWKADCIGPGTAHIYIELNGTIYQTYTVTGYASTTPTEPPTEPTEPTEPPTEPTEPPTEPTEPTEHPTEPTEPPIETQPAEEPEEP